MPAWITSGFREFVPEPMCFPIYPYCKEHDVAQRQCGEPIVASDASQIAQPETIAANGSDSGVDDALLIDAAGSLRQEPQLRCVAALLLPSTGIIDPYTYMFALLADGEALGTVIAHRTVAGFARRRREVLIAEETRGF
jgi:L-2-hydroxyglutarate oxidase LhgO